MTPGGAPLRRLALLTLASSLPLYGLAADMRPSHSGHVPARHASGRTGAVWRYVNPFVGTGVQQPVYAAGGAFTFPGAAFPLGMVQWSPDTTSDRTGGYTFGDTAIKGFSLTHLSGVGCFTDMDVPFMPTLAPMTVSPAAVKHAYAATFTHRDESASPGYYRVRLDVGITVELSVTRRTGFGRFTYPPSSAATMIINAGGSVNGDSNAGVQTDARTRTVTGSATSGGFCGPSGNTYTIYFAARFDQPFTAYGTWNGTRITRGSTGSSGGQSGAYVTFDTRRNRVVRVKVGLSYVSTHNALLNLKSEDKGWSFNRVQARAQHAWNGMLNRIQVQGGTLADRQTFYTALYHALLHPNVFSDVNGQYIGFDGRVHTAIYTDAAGRAHPYTQYANFSGWDIYRSEVPLLALVAPRATGDMMQSLVSDAEQNGTLPRWPIANADTGIMVGDPADPMIAGAYGFGATGFDAQGALRAMVKDATQPGLRPHNIPARPGLEEYLRLGYMALDGPAVWGPVATTLEYTTADFAIARFAQALGQAAPYSAFLRRAGNWKTIFNPVTGYIQPRRSDGSFVSPFDPTSLYGFIEGNSVQYSWMVPYDLAGLFTAMGGTARAARRLDLFFTQLNAGATSPYAWMGNETCAEVPWEYDFLGEPWRTQDVVRRIITTLYRPTPDGLPGNDDLGQMSSWYVFAALGLYPEIPGVPLLALGSPLFPRVTLHLAGGTVTITAPGATDGHYYVQSLTLNGQPYTRPWLPLESLIGAHLHVTLGTHPNTGWGSSPAAAPPSFAAGTLHP